MHTDMQRPSTGATIVRINGCLLYASLTGAFAWWLWPDTLEGWRAGFVSILLWAGAIAAFADAVKSAVKLYMLERALAEYMAQGNKPKIAEMASPEDLKRAGMIDEL